MEYCAPSGAESRADNPVKTAEECLRVQDWKPVEILSRCLFINPWAAISDVWETAQGQFTAQRTRLRHGIQSVVGSERLRNSVLLLCMRDTSKTGELTTVQVVAALARRDFSVWVPLVDSARRADILAEDSGGKIYRIQCKTGRLRNGCVEFRTNSVHRTGGVYTHRGYTGEVDSFGVYTPADGKCYLVPIEHTRTGVCYLRIIPPKTHIHKARWAKDFEL